MDWHSDFVGRGADLDVLKAAWDEARSGTPRVVAIVAESGFGKTRLAQEFYNWLSTHHDGVGEAGYWPDQLMREADNLRVNPSLDDLGDAQMTMPFLWWGLRLADPGARNAITNSALGSGLQTLNPHLAAMQRELERAEIKRRRLAGGGKTATELALDVGETAFEVVSSVGTFGILGLVKTLGEAAWDHRSANQELKALDARDVRPGAANQRERDLLAETVITDLARLCKNPAKGIDPVPIVLLVDDVQWLQTDDGTASFLDLLMARARAEAWPLMLLMTSWRREWRASQAEGTAPGTLTDLARGDIVHDLGPLEGLDKIIRKVLPGLTAVQVDALSEKAEGTPRFMDEMLMYLIRRRKAFVNRSTTDALTEAGLEDVLARDFAEFVADRLEQAPEYVRRALAIASMQGVSFSPRLVYRLAQGLSIVDAETGLSEGDDPHSFITGAHVAEGSEFRLRAYRTAAREDLGNLLDEVEAEETLRAALLELSEDVLKASDQELTLILNAPSLFDDEVTEWRDQIIAAGVVLIDRANKAFDTRKAGYLAERLLPLFEGHVGYEHPVALLKVIDAAFEWCGPDLKLVPPLERLTSQIREELEQYELLTNTKLLKLLSNVYSRLGEICKVTHGPEKGLECDVAALELERYFVQHEPNDERYLTLSLTLGNLTRTFQSLGYYDEARKYGEEALELLRALCEKNGERGPWSQLAQMLGHQGDYIAEKEGEASTIALRQEEEAILRRLLEKNPTTNLKRHLALTLGRMSKVFTANGDRDAALAAGEEELALLRKVIEDAPTLSYRRDLALSLGSFSNLVTNTKGLEASLPYNHEAIAILEDLFEESELLALTGDLSIEYGDLSRSVEKLEGPAAALPLREKATQYARDWVAMSDIPKRRRDLSISLDHLATLVNAVHGAAKALPLREEQVMVLRSCVAEEADPNDPVSLAYAIAHVSELVKTLEGPEPARVYAREEEALLRAAVDAAPNQSTELGLANALQRLTTLTEDIEGARDALPICTKRLALVRDIHRREPTSQTRSHLYSAVADLASMTDFLDGATAGLPLWAEAVSITAERDALDPSDGTKTDHANALHEHALVLFQLGDTRSADESWQQALSVLRKVKTPSDVRLWTLHLSLQALRHRALGEDPWAHAFALELPPSCKPDMLQEFVALRDDFAAWAAQSNDPDASAWATSAEVELARAIFASGDLAGAHAHVQSLQDGIDAAYLRNPGLCKNLTRGFAMLAGGIAQAAGDAAKALAHLDRAEALNHSSTPEAPYALRRSAMIAWHRSKALGQDEAAAESRAVAQQAARAFAAYDMMDGAAILKAIDGV